MVYNRRKFLKITSVSSLAISLMSCANIGKEDTLVEEQELIDICNKPQLKIDKSKQPIIIESMELVNLGETYFVRTRSKDGIEGISVTNKHVDILYPILLKSIIPFFIGKNALQIETLLDELYVHNSNYKMQGLALWCCVAWAEGSIIDLLGKYEGKHISDLFGSKQRDKVPIYVASGNRGTTPEEEIEVLQQRIEETGAKAVKFKVGGRMSRNKDSLLNRTEGLIELSRKILGDKITIQADANGSYGVNNAIEIGKRLEGIGAYLFEEPCRFDNFEETKQVADALSIPISGGEQESSEYRFRKLISGNILQIVQPDLHYYGGFIRASRVAKMADRLGKPITVHISNRNAGYAEMVNFSSYTPNIGLFQELKTGMEATADLFEPAIKVENGYLNVPTAPGLGMEHAEYALKNAKPIKPEF
ncbi:mandelate racemase/muconate lactonizing enzyme family protein [Tamlana flava]|uniref:mandelate racemase/muconate lactonizing enzyme family protein n=1 Tax=Tamlana flava TaxID=3158572 RepID=UPI00351AC496